MLAEVGVVLLLFGIGVEFSLERLAAIKGLIFGLGGLQVGLTILAVTGGAMAFGAGWRDAVFTGCLVSLSSTAIVLKLLGSRGESNTSRGKSALAVLIFQDLAVVAMVLLVPMLGGAGGGAGALGWALLKAVALIAVVLVVARRLMPPLLDLVARTCTEEVFLLSVVAICFGTAYLSGLAGVSLALGAFLAGLAVSESKFGHHAFAEVLPIQVLFSAAFFVSVGMLLDVRYVIANPLLVMGLTLGLFAVKAVTGTLAAVVMSGRNWSMSLAASAAVGLLLAQVGEFAFVLHTAGEGADLNFAGLENGGSQAFVAASVILLLLTPVMAWAAAKVDPGEDRSDAAPTTDGHAGELDGHVIINGFGPLGGALAKRLSEAGVPAAVVTLSPDGATAAEAMGLPTVREATSSPRGLESAGLSRARLVVTLDDDEETSRKVVGLVKGRYPDLPVWLAAEDDEAAKALRRAGADRVLHGEDGHALAADLLAGEVRRHFDERAE